MKRFWCVVCVALGCGAMAACGGDDSSGTPDAGSPVDAPAPPADTGPGAVDAGPCDPASPFGAPVELDYDESGTDESEGYGRLSADERTVYFTRTGGALDGGGGCCTAAVWMSTRAAATGSFGPAQLVANVNAGQITNAASVSADGLTLYALSDVPDPLNGDIVVATRSAVVAEFGVPERVGGINAAGVYDGNPYLRGDGRVLYFESDRGPVGYGLYEATLLPSGGFAEPVLVPGISGSSLVVNADGTVAYFASGKGADVWMAQRSTSTAPFGAPVELSSLNTPDEESPSWISLDGCRLYFTRRFPMEGYALRNYVASRAR